MYKVQQDYGWTSNSVRSAPISQGGLQDHALLHTLGTCQSESIMLELNQLALTVAYLR